MIQLTVIDNGDLEIKIIDEEDFQDLLKKEFNDERHYLLEMMDSGRYIGNDWDVPFDLGLTEIPAIGNGIEWDEEEGYPQQFENLWGYTDYMLKSFLDELEINGTVIFSKL